MLAGVSDQVRTRIEVPFAPRRDHADVGIERVVGKLEADLVVALAGGAVGHRVGAGQFSDLDLALGDQGPGDRGAEQVYALVERVGAEHRIHVIADEDLAQVLDEDLGRAQLLGLGPRRLDLLALADVGGKGDDRAAVALGEPLQNDRGIEATRVGEHDFLHRVRHG